MTYRALGGLLILALGSVVAVGGCADPDTGTITGDGDGDGDFGGGGPGEWPLPEPDEDPYEGVPEMGEVIDPSYGCRSVDAPQAESADLQFTTHPDGRMTVWDRNDVVGTFQISATGALDGAWGSLGELDHDAFALQLTDYVALDGNRLLVGGAVDVNGLVLDGVCLLDSLGAPDPTFGADGGCVHVGDAPGGDVRVAALDDGVLVFVGTQRLAKLDWAGAPVDTFATAGVLDGWTNGLGLPSDAKIAEVVASADAIHVLLDYDGPTLGAPRVVRLAADGSGPDADFVAAHAGLLNGLAPLDEDLTVDRAGGLAVAPNGSVALSGALLPEVGDGWTWVARLESTGAPAVTFGTGGVAVRQAGTWDITIGPAYVEHLALGFDAVGELWTAGRWWLDMPGLVRWTAGGDPGQEWFLHEKFLSVQDSLWPVHDAAVDLDRVTYLGTTSRGGDGEIYVCRVNLDP